MYKFDGKFQSLSSTQPDTEVLAIALQQKTLNSDIEELQKPQANIVLKLPHVSEEEKKNSTKTFGERSLETILSNLLKYGVLFASSVVLLGGILYLIRHGSEPANYKFFQGEPSEFRSPLGVINAVLLGSRRGIIQLGLLLLIAIPVLRVVISLLTFIWRREFVYVIITLIVLTSLTYSLVGAYY
ncbi:DUF1634 domain-containing protein [Tolypothrix sp. FACHB-123]|uniref:DUF1634 domain-containing protein n=1 Tax=Tolypothrix sp. FACHB-123 TaxID=2692868 RepID=UPI00168382C5|nr:DUF1634 domain-containing protein [Tolypothrix sp. FACHB-123]MBD2355122.1 DUF1634 domain-containing protein [Tolypothrix sp. FACHB-123]